MTEPQKHRLNIPRGVWVLGLVSLFMDTSSEIIPALLIFRIAPGSLRTSMRR